MENDLLHSFIHVIDAGSLSKAAEKLYLSSTALMKQMNVLEAQIGVQLLIRTHHGIRATDAGMSLYADAKFLLQYSEQAIARAHQAASTSPYLIRIGTSILNPCTVLVDLWNTISETYPQFKMKMVPFHGAEPCPTAYETLGKDFDVMVGAYDSANGANAFQALKLGEHRISVAVSREHPLARKDLLSVPDFSGEHLVMMQPGISPLMDGLRDYVRTEHPAIHIQDHPPQYTMELFNRCEERGAVLLTLDGWKEVHPFLVTIPVDWPYTIPYGVLYPLKPSKSVQLFVRALQEAVGSPQLLNHR
ncbi:LysR family transcriptional regulator [Ktedonospora formicarum]|uniref:HTH lysR-type domain-containing protein n=1 Tax=Ktedonospora formicarum TaxID=2778364 RepID=A0A8J3MYU7_9CHLR|nr:LysR family transcriptional regulator [Ktedonospora formicarum]GHO51193.1 hypothetical protein KSX_93560 [Ktedonospora formicarum]